jgi:hypothetical protein
MPEMLAPAVQAPPPRPAPAADPRRWPDLKIGYALLLPVLLACAAAPGFLYDPPGFLDSNVYVGYFLHHTEHLSLFEPYYKVSRLPWVFPGVAAYAALGPVAASYVLPLATLAFGLICLYLLLRDALDARTALFGVALLGTCRWFHGVGGWNYHMTATTCYYLLTVLCLVRAATGSRPRLWYFLAGAALSLTVHTHLFMAAFAPGLVVHYLLTRRPAGPWWKAVPRDTLLAAAGIVASTALLGAINKATGGRFQFYMPQIRYTLSLARGGNHWFVPASAWLPAAAFLVPPAVALVACPVTWLLGRPGGGEQGRARLLTIAGFQAQFVLAALVCCYYQFVKKQTILDHDYMAVCVLGPTILALCGFVYAVRDSWAHWGPHRVFAVTLALLAVPLLVSQHRGVVPMWVAPIVLPGLLGVAAALALLLARKTAWAFTAGVALLGLSNACAPWGQAGELYRDCFLFSIQADRFATRLDPTLVDIKYWYDTQETVETSAGTRLTCGYFDNFVSTRGWGGNLFGGPPPPAIPDIEAKHVGDFHRVAVLATTDHKEDYGQRMTERFAALGMPLSREAEQEFRNGQLAFSIVVYRIDRPAK